MSGDLLFSDLPRDESETAQSHNRLDGKIGIVSEMSGEIIRAELVFRIVSFFHQVIGPRFQRFPVLADERRIVMELDQCGGEDQHISALLHRHLIFLHLFTASIDLSVCERIGSEIMRSKRELPEPGLRIIQNRNQHPLQQFRLTEKKQRRGRIRHIHSCNAPVGEILLGEKQRPPLDIRDQFMRSNRLTERPRAEIRIFLTANTFRIVHQLGIEAGALFFERFLLPHRNGKQFGKRGRFHCPVPGKSAFKIFNGKEIMIRQNQITGTPPLRFHFHRKSGGKTEPLFSGAFPHMEIIRTGKWSVLQKFPARDPIGFHHR